jgi:hypothetical protein
LPLETPAVVVPALTVFAFETSMRRSFQQTLMTYEPALSQFQAMGRAEADGACDAGSLSRHTVPSPEGSDAATFSFHMPNSVPMKASRPQPPDDRQVLSMVDPGCEKLTAVPVLVPRVRGLARSESGSRPAFRPA